MCEFVAAVAYIIVAFLLFYKFVFLRDNKNRIPAGQNIVSPVSGRVINIQKISPSKTNIKIKKGFFGQIKTKLPAKEEYFLLNIFMNVHDVHFTKMPLAGEVVEIRRRAGKFLAVKTIEAAIENEKQEFVIRTQLGLAKVIQIAGLLARRCVSFVKVGDCLDKGAKLGQILLGSQVAFIIPSKKLKPSVSVGEKVSAGESIVFTFTRLRRKK